MVIRLIALNTYYDKEDVDLFFFMRPGNFNAIKIVKEMFMRRDITASNDLNMRLCEFLFQWTMNVIFIRRNTSKHFRTQP